MSTILITGITGRVGSRLARELLQQGHTVRGLAIPDDPLLARISDLHQLDLHFSDLSGSKDLTAAVDGVDTVVHLAAQMILNGSAVDLFEINVMGTMRLLETVSASAAPARFLLASTDGTYGVTRPRYLPVDEEHPQIPGDYYSGSKVLAERLLENYSAQFGIPYVILRFSTVIAPSESLTWFRYASSLARLQRATLGRSTNLWPLFVNFPDMDRKLIAAIDDPSSDPAVALLGPGRRPWGMPVTDVRDITQAIIRTIALSEWPNDRFNIAGPTITSDHGARVVADALRLPLHEVELPVHWHYEVDTRKARDTFGFAPMWSFEATVQDALRSTGLSPSEAHG